MHKRRAYLWPILATLAALFGSAAIVGARRLLPPNRWGLDRRIGIGREQRKTELIEERAETLVLGLLEVVDTRRSWSKPRITPESESKSQSRLDRSSD
jgi:hypothetical protein